MWASGSGRSDARRPGLPQVAEPDLAALVALAVLGDQPRLAALADVGLEDARGGAVAALVDQRYRATWAVEARATTAGRIEVAADVGVRLW